jgi:phosphatidylethanolamine-binding protein (PEBP) family uncharacterized protein
MMKRLAAASALLLCQWPLAVAQTALTVEWTWKRLHECSQTSPELKVTGVPADSKTLDIRMVDLNFRQFDHGGGSSPISSDHVVVVPQGTLKDYRGPCPMRNLHFGNEYEFTVTALAADGKTVLARGTATRVYGRAVVKD